MVNKDRGYDPHNVMMLMMWDMHPETRRSFIEELKTHTAIESVSTADVYFGEDFGMNSAWFDSYSNENYFHTSVLPADDAFLNTFNFKMKEGRFFEKDKQTDFDAAIINETALKEYSGKGSMIDKNIIVGDRKYTVIGIAKDFNFRSLHYPIQPLVITRIDNFGNVFIKVKNDQIQSALKILQKQWEKYKISSPLKYSFHDEILAEHYVKDQQAKRLLLMLSFLSIAIACVGLYAISFFRIVKRTKEIGIRKINGANTSEVVSMLNKDFLKWVALAFVIACPIAWFAMHKWLQNFAYKTGLSWWVFAVAGGLVIIIALFTVSWQSWKAARRNPVEALRYE
jgi:putative ABC transport system permease protein